MNDGDTDKCDQGFKVFCCPDPEYNEVINRCASLTGILSLFTDNNIPDSDTIVA